MSNKGDAYAVALAIYAGHEALTTDDLEQRLYHTVDSLAIFPHDEAKADCYAQLAEGLSGSTTFEDAVLIVEQAIVNTNLRYHLA